MPFVPPPDDADGAGDNDDALGGGLLEDLPIWESWLLGLGSVVVLMGLLLALASTPLRVPNPGTVLIVGVVLATFLGGLRVGLLSVLLSLACLGGYIALVGNPNAGASNGQLATQLGSHGIAAFVTAVLVGLLRRRTERRIQRERSLRRRKAALEKVKSNFLNVASHELRSPIAVARGYAAMLADGSFGPAESTDIRVALPVLIAKLDEMNMLVDSMLDAARLEEERLVLRCEDIDLRTIVDAAVQSALPSLTPRHNLDWRRPRAPVTVNGDAARLAIVVTNLVLNAIKYSPGGGDIQIFLSEDGGRALLTVWDHGLGIADEDMARLFTRFGRILTPENSHIAGTGLGLYLARELARLHNGDIQAASTAGRGSSFTLVLPLAEPRVEPEPDLAEPRPRTLGGAPAST